MRGSTRARMRRQGAGSWMRTRYVPPVARPHVSGELKATALPSVANSLLTNTPQLLDYLEERNISEEGGSILDWHACDLFPERWIDLVIVLRCDSTVLYDRLTARGYKDKKLEENMDSEIMQVLLDEAREAYKEEIVVELRSDSADDVDGNLERIEQWVENWRKDRGDEE
jgi:adenylate kinase